MVRPCSWDAVIPFEALWNQYQRIIKPNSAIVLTASQPFTTAVIASNIKWFRCSWIWVKTNCTGFANAKKQPLRCYDDVLVFASKQPTYNPQGLTRLKTPKVHNKNTSDFMGRTGFRDGYAQEFTNYPKNVLYFPSERSTIHTTQKPVAPFEYLIRTYRSSRTSPACVM
jgi:site-specific DNA-methyltransferase (adenine-specific)